VVLENSVLVQPLGNALPFMVGSIYHRNTLPRNDERIRLRWTIEYLLLAVRKPVRASRNR
jgi:hypothetical protein